MRTRHLIVSALTLGALFAAVAPASAAVDAPRQAGAAQCGTTLQSWTGPQNTATYSGTLRSGGGDGVVTEVVFNKGTATRTTKLTNGEQVGSSATGSYNGPSGHKLGFYVNDTSGEPFLLEFDSPKCDQGGQVTSARLSIDNGMQLGSVARR